MLARLVVVFTLFTGLARADGDPAAARAEALYEEGQRHFAAREYDAAVEAFQRAYDVSHLPGFLFNVALALRMKGDCSQALAYYARYLAADPTTPSRAKIEERIDEMRRCAVEPRAVPASAPPNVAVAPPPVPKRRRALPLALALPGAVLAVTGVGLVAQAAVHYDDLSSSCGHACPPSSTAGYRGREIAGYVLLGVGAAGLTAGLVTWLVRPRVGSRR